MSGAAVKALLFDVFVPSRWLSHEVGRSTVEHP